MARYFTSDTHFGDHRVLNLYHRPFASSAAMDEALIAAWNATCGPDDEVWHLGISRAPPPRQPPSCRGSTAASTL